jgi:hypothetical protein
MHPVLQHAERLSHRSSLGFSLFICIREDNDVFPSRLPREGGGRDEVRRAPTRRESTPVEAEL